jgi:hypothetical protein
MLVKNSGRLSSCQTGSSMCQGQHDCFNPAWDTGSMAGVMEGILKWRMRMICVGKTDYPAFSFFYPSMAASDSFVGRIKAVGTLLRLDVCQLFLSAPSFGDSVR